MKKKSDFFLLNFFISLVVLLGTVYVAVSCFVGIKCFNSASSLSGISESQELLRIKVYGSSYSAEGNTVSASFSVIDSNGNEIAQIERSWSGSYLAAEFASVTLYGNTFLFPYKIYGKDRITEERFKRSRGTRLEKYYDDCWQCMLLGHGSSLKERKNLFWISVLATKKYHLPDFGLIKYYTVDLSDCRSDRFYSVVYENSDLIIREL